MLIAQFLGDREEWCFCSVFCWNAWVIRTVLYFFFSSLFVTLFLLLDGVHETPQTSNLIKTVIQYQFDQTTYRWHAELITETNSTQITFVYLLRHLSANWTSHHLTPYTLSIQLGWVFDNYNGSVSLYEVNISIQDYSFSRRAPIWRTGHCQDIT